MSSSSERKYLNPRDKSLMKPRGDVSLSAFGFLFSEMVSTLPLLMYFIYFVLFLAVVFLFASSHLLGFALCFHAKSMCILV